MTVKQNVPALRFPEFEGVWKIVKLGEVADIKRGAASQHLNYVSSENEGIRLIRINDFLSNDPVYIEETEDIQRFRVAKEDILMAGTGATAGIVFIVPNEFDGLAYSYNAPRIRVNHAHYKFVYFYLLTETTRKQQQALFVGNAQHFLDTDAMRSLRLSITSQGEQQKIAAFLSAVDDKIQQLTRKKALLEQYKKGVMQQLFSQQLRFRDDAGNDFPDWEEKMLGEIASKVGSGSTPKGGEKAYVEYGIPFIRSQNVNNGQLDLTNLVYITEEIHAKMNGSAVKANDILLNITGASIGRSCVVPNDFLIGNVNQHVCIIRLKEGYEPFYLHAFLSSNDGQNIIEQSQSGSGREGLNFQSIRRIKTSFPCKVEQQKIASFISAIDEKINQVTTQLQHTQQWKKGLLQQMFV